MSAQLEMTDLRRTVSATPSSSPVCASRSARRSVLDGIDFTVGRGTVFALLGANGSGKTTTINILTTLIKADGGTASVAGFDVAEQPSKVREQISVTGQFAAVDHVLTARENLVLMGELRHVADPRQTAADLLDRFDLDEAADRRLLDVLGRDAAPARHRHEPRRRRTHHLLRRADDRARPQEPDRHVCDDPATGRAGHDRLPDHAVPGGGRPSRRRDRHPPRRPDRGRRHTGRAEGHGADRARRTGIRARTSNCSRRSEHSASSTTSAGPTRSWSSPPPARWPRWRTSSSASRTAGSSRPGSPGSLPTLDDVFFKILDDDEGGPTCERSLTPGR